MLKLLVARGRCFSILRQVERTRRNLQVIVNKCGMKSMLVLWETSRSLLFTHLKILSYVNWIAQKAIDRMLERLPTLNYKTLL
jgi:hypothetical protein